MATAKKKAPRKAANRSLAGKSKSVRKTTSEKKVTSKGATRSLADQPSAARSATPMTGAVSQPVNPGGMHFSSPFNDSRISSFSIPMQGVIPGEQMPLPGMLPPMPDMQIPPQSDDLLSSVGNMLRLGVDALSATLASGTQIMQGFAGQERHSMHYGYGHYPYGMSHGAGHHHHGHYCGSYDPACYYPSCCDCYGQSCCHPSVHGCDC